MKGLESGVQVEGLAQNIRRGRQYKKGKQRVKYGCRHLGRADGEKIATLPMIVSIFSVK